MKRSVIRATRYELFNRAPKGRKRDSRSIKMTKKFTKQHQNKQPGIESKMQPHPEYLPPYYRGSGKLDGKTALITGGDSGIGRAVACAFALEGCDLIIHYLNEHEDAKKTKQLVEELGGNCWLFSGNL